LIPEWSDWRNGEVWWIHSVFIEPAYRGKGVFSKFYAYVKALVETDPKVRGLRLYVDKTNKSAQAIYGKLGMNGEHYNMFEWMKTF
jgi:GNAT superfamily N-acetyltransferase